MSIGVGSLGYRLWAWGSRFYSLGYGINKLEAGGVKGYNPLGRISGWGKPKYA